jgi:hypothetical protein
MTREELDAKYLANVGRVLSAEQARESLDVLNTLEQRGARELVNVLCRVEVRR